jgi:hypothetical protein
MFLQGSDSSELALMQGKIQEHVVDFSLKNLRLSQGFWGARGK